MSSLQIVRQKLKRARELGFSLAVRKGLIYIFKRSIGLAFFPIALCLSFKFRVAPVICAHVGHLFAEVDCLLKEEILNRDSHVKVDYIIIIPIYGGELQDAFLRFVPKDRIWFVTNPILSFILKSFEIYSFVAVDTKRYILSVGSPAHYYKINLQWGKRSPLFRLNENDQTALIQLKRFLGIPENKEYLCLHDRRSIKGRDDNIEQLHRQWTCDDYLPELTRYLDRNDLYCVCMGETTPSKEFYRNPRIIRYSDSCVKRSYHDVLLIAGAKNFIGGSSGLFIVAGVFGVRCLLTNMLPISGTSYFLDDITIFKRIFDRKKQRFIPLNELLSSDVTSYRASWDYETAGLDTVMSSIEEFVYGLRAMEKLSQDYSILSQDKVTEKIYSDAYGYHSKGLVVCLPQYI